MKNYILALLAAGTFVACSDTDTTVDPNIEDSSDSSTVIQYDDSIHVEIAKANSSLQLSYPVYVLRPSRTLHDISLRSAAGIASGSITVAVMKNEETLWQHTFTTDSTTWNVTGQIQGAIGTISVQSTKATGRVEGYVVGR